MEQILLAYCLVEVIVNTIMMHNENTKAKVCSPNGDTDYFDIVVAVLQEDPLAPILFIIYLDYKLKTSIDLIKENGLTKKKSKEQTISRGNYKGRILRRWHCASRKYTFPSWIPAA